MKRKLAILLSSVVASAGLVGATFAAWAVTDNADPFGIKISPGDITDTITYDTLTLDWGDTSKFVAVSNLRVDVPQYRYVQVKATDSAPVEGKTKGSLTASFIDETPTKGEGAKYLIDYLHVDVYKVATDSTVPSTESIEMSLPTAGSEKTDTKDIQVTNATVQNLAFKVYLPSTGITTEIYEEIKNDVVNLRIDWNKSSTHTEAEGSIIYYSGTHDEAFVPRVYAWTSTGIGNNGTFGTVLMTPIENTNVYSYVLKNTFDSVIFIYGQDELGWKQTSDIEVTSTIRSNTPMYNGTDWEALSLVEHGFYVVGSQNGWKANTDFKLTGPTDDEYAAVVTVSAEESAAGGVDFKILDTVHNDYYSEYDINGGSNFNLGEAGTYDIKFATTKKYSGNTAYILATKR